MKIILSRKGFDLTYGGQPSPILPDGTLLSFPIPIENDRWFYDQIFYNRKSYLDIIKELKPKSKISKERTCHLDPDIRKSATQRAKDWKAIFGQCDAAQGHLINQGIELNDIFLFFGWFKLTEIIDGHLKYVKGAPDLHIMYGYLQIGEIYKCGDNFPEYTKTHSHVIDNYADKKSNCIYVANDKLSINNKFNGWGCFKFDKSLVLTKEGKTKGKWELPDMFKGLAISYHPNPFKEDYFQSADIGQEFVIEEKEEVEQLVQQLIENFYDETVSI